MTIVLDAISHKETAMTLHNENNTNSNTILLFNCYLHGSCSVESQGTRYADITITSQSEMRTLHPMSSVKKNVYIKSTVFCDWIGTTLIHIALEVYGSSLQMPTDQ